MAFEIIDIHPHIVSDDTVRYPLAPVRGKQSTWSKERPQTFEVLIAEMDAGGVSKAAIVQSSTSYGTDNSYLMDSVATNPERFTAVCTIDTVAPDAEDVLEALIARGMTGLRIFTGGASHAADDTLLTDPRSYAVWEDCGAKKISIAVQTNPISLPKVRELIERFPGTRVILDHCGRPNLEDGPPYKAAEPMFDLAQFSNVYLKITPRTFALARSGKSTPEDFFGKLVDTFGSNRLAWGSNLPANPGPMKMLVEEAKDGLASLSEGDRAQILGGTAKILYPSLA